MSLESLDPAIRKIIKDSYPQIEDLNPAQKAVVEAGLLEEKENFIIAIPTASGKTLLGVMAALRTILEGGKVVYTVPLLSIQNEKVKEFKKFEEHGIKVGKHPSSSDLAVMVFESYDALTRFNWNTLSEVDLVIVDEFHMIGEYSRGPTIECAITRSRIINPGMRLIALSATLQNMEELSTWLGARVVEHDYRPVPLYQEVLNTEEYGTKNKNDVILRILKDSMEESSQALVFVSTRRFTESLANYLAGKIKRNLPAEKKKTFKMVAEKILDVPRRRGSLPTEVCLKLAECVENGMAFHHAGLFDRQKEIIEEEFRAGNLLMITATPSLMYGVNLPSKNVVIRDYTRWTSQGPQPIPVFDYLQMSGRAGRPGYDKEGYSYLIGKTLSEAEQLQYQYVYGEIEATNSKLLENRDAVYRQIISQVAAGMARNLDELMEFFQGTFSGFQMTHSEYSSLFASDTIQFQVKEALDFLTEHGMIQVVPDGLRATAFGMLIAKSNYAVQTAVRLKEFARSGGEVDMSRLVYEICRTPDLIPISFKGRKSRDPVRDRLNQAGLFVVDVGNDEATAATLMEWMDERSEYEIENAFHVYAASTRRAAYEASQLVKFHREICQVLGIYTGLDSMEVLAARLYYGVKEELLPLVVGIKRLGRRRARALVDAFGTDLRYVSREELLRIEGIGPKTAENILKKYHTRD
ncbi:MULTISPECIES: DEAD/DEAH box helicase [Methanobacterium]|jgi:helicase|uniref:ATP-dependent DNA helicase Hel308 n=1 Tax=Methanobacterium formicicum TaxID=2162 RepID=A0A090I875_METFO|nr:MULTISPECIES: DEAD/DEAH box helicase [Methanobacterium]KUK71938.1 MAG: DEAD/DEAH box helicase domain-containing protein [Methanobacterium sp. 42_16]MDH2660094.1 DEAD/DEAH box helicase [Methanobacterium formicicum]CEA14485.1 putative ski2-type helicase [Methanobacterium formicicum]